LTKNEIVKLLDHMPEQYRKILVMSVIDDYSHAEISETLGITPKKSRLLLYRALKWIRENRSRKELSLFSREMAIQSK
jgi:RNA polymerase sigma factor (sigma-70 family)